MHRYRFWFDDVNYGISKGSTPKDAFEYFLNKGFDYTDVIDIEIEQD